MPKLKVNHESFVPEGQKEAVTYSRLVITSDKNPNIAATIRVEKNEISLVEAILALDK